MPLLRVTNRDGVEQEIRAPAGGVLMEPLRDMDDGVTAICGGMCSCATCHVYVDEAWMGRLPAAMSDETDMLKDLSSYRANSRLSCQIQLTEALEGLHVTIAPEE
jgi:2Fe-2S ferredoxin